MKWSLVPLLDATPSLYFGHTRSCAQQQWCLPCWAPKRKKKKKKKNKAKKSRIRIVFKANAPYEYATCQLWTPLHKLGFCAVLCHWWHQTVVWEKKKKKKKEQQRSMNRKHQQVQPTELHHRQLQTIQQRKLSKKKKSKHTYVTRLCPQTQSSFCFSSSQTDAGFAFGVIWQPSNRSDW